MVVSAHNADAFRFASILSPRRWQQDERWNIRAGLLVSSRDVVLLVRFFFFVVLFLLRGCAGPSSAVSFSGTLSRKITD